MKKTVFAAKLVKQFLAFANSGGGYLIIGYKTTPTKGVINSGRKPKPQGMFVCFQIPLE